ncbi:hypothetical protein GCM10023187_10150 [Nibrella viscosa]|uniref:Uncharacterized protein n=1 Tax=Nibrella viscosa TaxID=1084524 RepID=A0ABP8K0Z7_9BACT
MYSKINTLRIILIALFAFSLFVVHRLLFQPKGLFPDYFTGSSSVVSAAAISFSAVAGFSLVCLLILTPPQTNENQKP